MSHSSRGLQRSRTVRPVACVVCRQAKMRCVGGEEAGRCDRCIRWNRDCVFQTHRRGRRPRDLLTQSNEGAQYVLSGSRRSSFESQSIANDTHVKELPSVSLPGSHPAVSESFSLIDGLNQERDSNSDNKLVNAFTIDDLLGNMKFNTSPDALAPPFFVDNTQDTGDLSLNIVLDPIRGPLGRKRRTSGDKTATSTAKNDSIFSQDDPIEKRILSFPSAQSLYDGYLQHFNYLTGTLDPSIYTFSFTRNASCLLFTVVLCIASRVFRPELRSSLRDHAETLLGRALLECDSSIETIWAIVCLYYWKDVGDKRGYNLVGFAQRMAWSAEWNKTRNNGTVNSRRKSDSVESELDVRQLRDKERLWLVLCNIDRSSSYFTSRPLSAAPLIDGTESRSWLTCDKWSYPVGDSTAIAGNELNQLARPVYEFVMKTKPQDSDNHNTLLRSRKIQMEEETATFEKLMQEFNEQLSAWGDFWGPVYAKFTQPSLEPLTYSYREYVQLYFNSIRLHRIVASGRTLLDPAVASATAICYSSALRLLRQIVTVGKLDVLYYLWDTAYLMTGYAAMMLLKIVTHASELPGICRQEALQVLSELAHLHASSALSLNGSSWSPPVRETLSPETASGSISAENALEAQTRLLKAIVQTIQEQVKNHSITSGHSDASIGLSPLDDICWQHDHPPLSNENSGVAIPTEDLQIRGFPFDLLTSEPENVAISELIVEMDFSLDTCFLDSRFMDTGLLSWDVPGIFINPH